jgi:pimeloyl-ACP methyl ester carboxylesterase
LHVHGRWRTEPFRDGRGEILAESIAEVRALRLGGEAQWVIVRGKRIANPVLILLHGGPGFPERALFRHFNASLEQSFTVVYWEQRGTARSFHRGIPPSSMTVEQFLLDLDALVEAIRRRLRKERVVLYGHSWGSALGVLYAARFPEKVSAYVGAGQVGDWPASERASYAFTVTEAERRGRTRAVAELRALGPPPHSGRQVRVQRAWLARFVGIVRGLSWWGLLRIVAGGSESSLLDLPRILRGLVFSERMWPEVSALDLTRTVPALRVPVFFFLGRHDHVIDATVSAAYFERLQAPAKTLLWFENSAHEPPFEEPEKFNRAMVDLVRPVVLAAERGA